MDSRLQQRLDKWHKQIQTLKEMDEMNCLLESSEKTLEGKIFLSVEGKNNDIRFAKVHTHQDWIDFQAGKAAQRARYLETKRLLEIKIKAYEAEYLTLKVQAEAIKKHP